MASKNERTSLTPKLISLAVASCFATGAALANPTGHTVVSGSATVTPAGNLLTIQNSPNAIINWNGFSISAGEITRFIQQNPSSAVLNRVVGGVRSDILGALQSRMLDGVTTGGRVFLINPSGIVFGPGAQIDVGGLVASTLALSNEDFLGGRLRFTAEPGAGSVVNQGSINAATGGQVYLVGPSVTNNGIITSPKGEVILAAGNSVELVNPGTPNLRVEITAPDNEARNLGSIVADAGRVGIYAGLIHHGGTIRADSAAATEDGRIVLRATKNTTIDAGSIISASGPSGGQVTIQSGDTTLVSGSISATGSAGKGGTVQVLGNLVGLDGDASIDVSGEGGGGTALVGGGFQGKDPNVQNASRTWFGPNAKINADAIGSGDGGTVIVWSDDATGAYGTISARGGSEAGNGGFVEVSSRGWLDFHAKVDTSAPKGRTGTLLLDPADVCIYTNFSSCAGGEGSGQFYSGGGSSKVFFSQNTGNSQESQIEWGSGGLSSLLVSNNVTVTTSNSGGVGSMGSVRFVDPDYTYSSNNLFQVVAHDDVHVNGRIWNTGQGELRIYAGWNEAVHPVGNIMADPSMLIPVIPTRGNINVNATIDMHGNTRLRAGGDIVLAADKQVKVVATPSSSVGDRSLDLEAGNAVRMLANSSLQVDASGGEGGGGVRNARLSVFAGAGGVTVDGGAGAFSMMAKGSGVNDGFMPVQRGGNATIEVGNAGKPIQGPVTFSNSAEVIVQGGYGKQNPGGDSRLDVFSIGAINVDNSLISGLGGAAGSAGPTNDVGGNSLVQLGSNGDINISGSNGGSFTGAKGVMSQGGTGGMGGGKGELTLSSGGSINANNAFIGAAGRNGALASINAAANGALSVVNNSLFLASGGSLGPAAGGMAQILGKAGSINVSGSQMQVVGGSASSSGSARGGDAFLSFESPTGPIAISQSTAFATGGSGPVGGDGLVTIGGSGLVSFLKGLIDGGDVDLAAAQAAIAKGPVSITNSSVSGQGGQGQQSSGGSGGFVAMTTADFSMLNSSVHGFGGFGVTAGGDAGGIVMASNIRLESTSSSSSPTTLLVSGGSTSSSSGLLGSADVLLAALGPTGQISLINERVDVSGGQRGSGSSATFGPGNIILIFPNRTEGGFSVNGVEGAITGSPVGFFVNGQPAIPGTNFFAIYGGIPIPESPPATFDAQLISSLFTMLEDLTPQTEIDAPTKEEKDQKKKEREC